MPINRELSQFGSFVEVANSTKLGIVNPNVGIGTTNPTVKVEVHGSAKITGSIDCDTDLDVDGHTELDTVNVSAAATFAGGVTFNSSSISATAGLVANTAKVSDLTDNRVVIAGNAGELEDDARLTFNGSNLTVGLSSGFTVSKDGDLTLTGVSTTSSAGPELKLYRNSPSPADADYIGQIKFAGEGSEGEEKNYAKITGKILDSADGSEDGALEFAHIKAGSQVITGRWRSDSLQLLNSTNFSVNGNTTLEGNLDVDGHTDLDYVAVSAAATITGLVDVNGGLQANSAKIEDLTNGRVVLAGVGGELQDNTKLTFDGQQLTLDGALTASGVSTFSSSLQAASFVTGASGAAIGVNTNTISGPAEITIDPAAVGDNTGAVRIKGDLYVDGTTTQINSTTLEIADFVVGIASTATTDSLADGAGINIGPDNTFKYDHTNTSLKSSENLNVASGKTYKVNGTDVLSATTLGSNVVNSSLTSVGTLGGLTVGANGINVSGVITATSFSGVDTDKISEGNTEVETVDTGSDGHVKITTEGTERLRILAGGQVAIGTVSSAAASTNFDDLVVGHHGSAKRTGITLVSANNQDAAICFSDGTGGSDKQRGQIAYMHDPSSSSSEYLDFYVAGSQAIRFDGDGRFLQGLNGGNSQLASAKLQVYSGDDTNNIAIINSSASDSDGARTGSYLFRGRQSGGEQSTLAAIMGSHDGSSDDQKGNLILKTNDGSDGDSPTERLRIDSSGRLLLGSDTTITDGNFGIGNLQVTDKTGFQHVLISGHSAAAANATCLSVGRSRGTQSSPGYLSSGDHIARFSATSYNGGNYQSSGAIDFFAADQHASGDLPGYISFKTVPDGSTTLTERLRITSAGNIGIGLTNPDLKLHVNGTNALPSSSGSTATGHLTLRNKAGSSSHGMFMGVSHQSPWGSWIQAQDASNNATNYPLLLNPNGGNVGVGEDNPDVRLHVKETINTAYSLTNMADEANHLLKLENPSTTANAFSGMQFRVGSGADLFFGAIQQSVNHGDFFFANQNSPQKEMMRIKSSGEVGIGTDNPTNDLVIESSGSGKGLVVRKNSVESTFLGHNGSGNEGLLILREGGTNKVQLYAESGQPSFINSGNVGINSASPAVKFDIRSTDAIRVPVGTTGERPTGAAGLIRYNSTISSYEGHNGSEWAGIGGAAEVETSVSSTSATTCESFAKATYRSATIVAQITQGTSYQVGNYLLIHDGTTATLIEESAVATGDMLGTFTATISGSNVVFQVNMNSASSATVTSKMTKVSIP